MTNPAIQPATRADIPALQAVLDNTELFPSDMLPDMMALALDTQSEEFWLTCHVDGAAVGLCYVAPEMLTDGTWNMIALAVAPDQQGKGLGGALVKAAETRLKTAGQRILIVETSGTDDFESTRRFYEKRGYNKEAVIRDFWKEGDDKVIYWKKLTS